MDISRSQPTCKEPCSLRLHTLPKRVRASIREYTDRLSHTAVVTSTHPCSIWHSPLLHRRRLALHTPLRPSARADPEATSSGLGLPLQWPLPREQRSWLSTPVL